jgi:hypothetical protein
MACKSITIGGSELAALLLLNKYVSLEDLFNKKVGTMILNNPLPKSEIVTFTTPVISSAPLVASKKLVLTQHHSLCQTVLTQHHCSEHNTNDARYHGIIFEPVVIEIIEGLFGTKMYNKQKKLSRDGLVYKPDGMIDLDDIPHVVEIKAPRSRKLNRGSIPREYIPQLELGTYMTKVDRSMYFEASFRHVPLGKFLSRLSAPISNSASLVVPNSIDKPTHHYQKPQAVLTGIIIAFAKCKTTNEVSSAQLPKIHLADYYGADFDNKKHPSVVWDAYGRLLTLGPKHTFRIFDMTKPVMPQFMDAVPTSTNGIVQILAWELTDANCVIRKHTGTYMDKVLPFVHRFIKLGDVVKTKYAEQDQTQTPPNSSTTPCLSQTTSSADAKKEIAQLRKDISNTIFDSSANTVSIPFRT